MRILNIKLISAYQISLETTLTGNDSLDSILKFDPIISVIELLKNDPLYKQIALHIKLQSSKNTPGVCGNNNIIFFA